MNQQNVILLKSGLLALGCDTSIEPQLLCQLCFSPLQFDLAVTRLYGEDTCQFLVHIEKKEQDQYLIKYHSATLRKKVFVPDELLELDKRMSKIDWALVARTRKEPTTLAIPAIQSACEVLQELRQTGTAGDVLQYKYWQGTELDTLIHQSALHKAAWEISERFYFFDDLEVISFKEAVRFLNSRWMERQMVVRKKMLEKTTDEKSNQSRNGLLLKKKPRRTAKTTLFKS